MSTQLSSKQKIIEDNERQLAEVQKSLEELRHEHRLALEGLADTAQQLEVERNKSSHYKEKVSDHKKECAGLIAQLNIRQAQLEDKITKLKVMKDEVSAAKQECEDKSLTIARLSDELKKVVDDVGVGADSRQKLQEQLAEARDENKELSQKAADLEVRISSYDDKLRAWVVEKATLQTTLETRFKNQYEKQIIDLEKKVAELEEEKKSL